MARRHESGRLGFHFRALKVLFSAREGLESHVSIGSANVSSIDDQNVIDSSLKQNGFTLIAMTFSFDFPPAASGRAPKVISIFEEAECSSSKAKIVLKTALKVKGRGQEGTKGSLAICIKALDFPTNDSRLLSLRVLEWIEALLAVGVNMIYLYDLAIGPRLRGVIQKYVDGGKVSMEKVMNQLFLTPLKWES